MSECTDKAKRLLVEVCLRDSKNLPVIMALDRLVLFPKNKDQYQHSIDDLKVVKEFISSQLPESLQADATKMFIEHAHLLQKCAEQF